MIAQPRRGHPGDWQLTLQRPEATPVGTPVGTVELQVGELRNLIPEGPTTVVISLPGVADAPVMVLHPVMPDAPVGVGRLQLRRLPSTSTATPTSAPNAGTPNAGAPDRHTACNAFAEQRVCAISVPRDDGYADIWLKNTEVAVVTARLVLVDERDAPTDDAFTVVVPAGEVVRATTSTSSIPARWRATLRWQLGAARSAQETTGGRDGDGDDDVVYLLPWDRGERRYVHQGPGGSFSHAHSVAWDFGMEEGSRVLAARSGVVAFAEDSSKIGGGARTFLEDGNVLLVVHDDGSVGLYGHLRFAGAWKRVGERVDAGELLALSGNTGFSTGPHLHFQVQRPTLDGGAVTIPIRFETQDGPKAVGEGWVVRP